MSDASNYLRAAGCCALLLLSVGTALSANRFTVRDSIEMTRIVSPRVDRVPYEAPAFQVSPDEKHFVIVTMRGNLETGLNKFTLYVLHTDQVRQFIGQRKNKVLPRMDAVTQFETTSTWPAIDCVEWLPDSTRIAFIGRSGGKIGQVHTYDLEKRQLEQLTHENHNIVRFALAADAGLLLYAAETPPDWSVRNSHGYAVQSEYVESLTHTDPQSAVPDIRYYALDLRTNETIEAKLDPSRVADKIELSPSGNWAVINSYSIRGLPSGWLDYESVRSRIASLSNVEKHFREYEATGATTSDFENEAFGAPSDLFSQRYLLNTRTGAAQPLLKVPSLRTAAPVLVAWSQDERRLVMGPTFLPLHGTPEDERARRRKRRALAEIDLVHGSAVRIVDLAVAEVLRAVKWRADGSIDAQVGSVDGQPTTARRFTKLDQVWIDLPAVQASGAASLRLGVSQDVNTPYEIYAEDVQTGAKRVITNLNPQLSSFDLGRVEPFAWEDRQGRHYEGGLLLPPHYKAGMRYPVVLQTYGFTPEIFLVDGPRGITSGYAARPLASSGIIVLQMGIDALGAAMQKCRSWESCGENPTFVAMIEGAIDALDADGLIDRRRVGIIGWSREGMHVFYAVTFSSYPIAAATVADSVAVSPLGYVLAYGISYPGMRHFEDMIGGPYWAEYMNLWQERSPSLQLSRIRTPLRFETYGTGIPAYWDVFATMKRQRRPVEMIHIPLESHRLQTPFGRYTSQQGNVDWFRFWLLDEEDSHPAKAEQYRRWRKLRVQHEAHESRRPQSTTMR